MGMSVNKAFSVVVSLLAAGTILAQGESKMQSTSKMGAAAKAPVIKPAAELKWADMGPDAPGVKIVDVWGDHTKGAFGAFIKFPAGFATPLHTHTNAFHVVVVSGTFVQGPEGKPEFSLPSGSYLLQPGDGYRHTTKCAAGSECVIFAESKGKFDLIPAEAAKK